MNYVGKNITFLKKGKGVTQPDIALQVGKGGTTISNWEKGTSEPSIEDLQKLSNYFEVSIADLVNTDLANVDPIKNDKSREKRHNVDAIVDRNVDLSVKNQAKKVEYRQEIRLSIAGDSGSATGSRNLPIPITDISVAAGSGIYNSEHLENLESMSVPTRLLKKRNGTYLWVRIKGPSMAPTLIDGGLACIRLLDRSEWANMHNEYVYVVSDTEGQAYLKRVKNRFKKDFIVLMSDNPDKATYPNFNLQTGEINSIWELELSVQARFPNIHDQYYSRLQHLEDKVDDLLNSARLINPK